MTQRTAALLLVIGGGAMIVGSLLPWSVARNAFGSTEFSGTDTDGVVTLALGAVLTLVGLLRLDGALPLVGKVFVIGLGAAGLYTVATNYAAISAWVEQTTTDQIVTGIGIGLYVVGLGALTALVGAAGLTSTKGPDRRSSPTGW